MFDYYIDQGSKQTLIPLQNLDGVVTETTIFVTATMFALLLLVLCGVDRAVSGNNEVWRSTSMVNTACELEAKYQETGQFPEPIKDQQQKDHCGWFSKGKPRGDACADIRVHYTSCENNSIARQESVRIINGTNARRAFPSIAFLQSCTGSVINNEWLLTAAHCACSPYAATYLTLAYYDLEDPKNNPFLKTVKRIKHVCHENYSRTDPFWKALAWDIAVEKVEKFEYNEGIQPIKMPPSRDFRYMGPAYAVGYGITGEPGKRKFVKEFTTPVVSTKACTDAFPGDDITEKNHVCAGDYTSGKTSCNGDSGGPLFICQNYQLVQYGVLSGGEVNCKIAPAIYVRLSTYMDWVLNTIQNN